jgi:hypothetical protein
MIRTAPNGVENNSMFSLQKDLQIWMLRGLVAAAGSMFVLTIAAILWGLLDLLGDETGARVARGVALTAGVAWAGILSVLVLLLTCDRIAPADSQTTETGTAMNSVYDGRRSA